MINIVTINDYQEPNDKAICPTCKKPIEPKFSIKTKTGQIVGAYYENVYLLGCPECKTVFYKEINNPFLKKK